MISPTIVSACLMMMTASLVTANWDPATGHARDYLPTAKWYQDNKHLAVTMDDIQVAECAMNTRLHFPNVQLFAMFVVNHKQDGYHGCPYGACHAFTVAPKANELVPAFTHGHSFYWHGLGGTNKPTGHGVKPISDPQTGAYGYEESISGKFIDGPMNYKTLQLGHDTQYPSFKKLNLAKFNWTEAEREMFSYQKDLPLQPKCGTPCGPNLDPGSTHGAFGHYVPARASAYIAPPNFKLDPSKDKCDKLPGPIARNSGGPGYGGKPGTGGPVDPTKPDPTNPVDPAKPDPTSTPKPKHSSGKHCKKFCACIQKCQGDECGKCALLNKNECSEDKCSSQKKRANRCR